MTLFLFLLFPIGLLICARIQGAEKFPKYMFIAFCGLFSAAVFCAYKYFFSPVYYLPQDSFWLNFLYYFIKQTLLPMAVLAAVFLFVAKKDSLDMRIECLFPLFAGFYAVYIPFLVLCSALPYPFFLLFAKPVIYFAVVFALPKIAGALFASKVVLTTGKKCILIFALVLALILPAAIEALWVIL